MKISFINLLSICLILLLSSCSNDDFSTEKGNSFATSNSVALKFYNNNVSSTGKNTESSSYREVEVINFDSNTILKNRIVINGIDFLDNGENADKTANDGIYTSVVPLKPSIKSTGKIKSNETVILTFDDFAYDKELTEMTSTMKSGIKINCKISHTKKGTSLLGYSCDDWFGCIVIHDCEIGVEL